MQSVNPAVMQVFEVMGLTAFSISGAIAAYRRDLDIIGYIAVGVITGIGGGTIRDVILDRPVFWLNDPYLYSLNICIAASIFTYIVSKFMSYHEKTVNWFDAVGLALFAVQGYSMAYAFFEHREVAVVMGVITGCGGGLFRDICLTRQPFIFRGELYASAAIIGLISMAFLDSAIIAFCIIFTLRALAIRYHISLKRDIAS